MFFIPLYTYVLNLSRIPKLEKSSSILNNKLFNESNCMALLISHKGVSCFLRLELF